MPKGNTIENNISWNHFSKIQEDRKFYILSSDNYSGYMIPKRCFRPEDLKEFHQFIQSLNIPKE